MLCFAARHADWWNHVVWGNNGKQQVLQFTNRPWHHGFSKAHSVTRNYPWVVEQCRSSLWLTPVTAVFAHRRSRPGWLALVWSGCGLEHSMRLLRWLMKVKAVAGGQMDLYWRRALRGWEGGVGEGGDRRFDDLRSSLSQKGELCTSHNNQHCYRDVHYRKMMTSQRRNLLLCWRIYPPAQSRSHWAYEGEAVSHLRN